MYIKLSFSFLSLTLFLTLFRGAGLGSHDEERRGVANLLCTMECLRDCGKHSGVGMPTPISSPSSKLTTGSALMCMLLPLSM